MAAPFKFEIHTLYRLFFSGMVESITLTLNDGDIGVYANHSFFTAPVLSCILRVKDEGGVRLAFITDGILEVKGHGTVLMVDAAEWPDEIDVERARTAMEEAERDIAEATLPFELESAKARLRRAQFRLKAHELKVDAKTAATVDAS
jgi:F-type H+-transporting ATPase subunit epsilon